MNIDIDRDLPYILERKFETIDEQDSRNRILVVKTTLNKYTYRDSFMSFKLLAPDLLEMGGRLYYLKRTQSCEELSDEINYYIGNSGEGLIAYHYYIDLLNTMPPYGEFVDIPQQDPSKFPKTYEENKRVYIQHHFEHNGLSRNGDKYCDFIGAEWIFHKRGDTPYGYAEIIFHNTCFVVDNTRGGGYIWLGAHDFATFKKFDRYLLTISVDYETYINTKTQALEKLAALEKHNSDLRAHIAQLEKNADMLRDHHESIISATLADEYLCAEYYKKQADKTLDEYCVVCMDAAAEYLIVPCGHLAYCEKCCEKIDTCAICRGSKSCAVKVHKIST